MSALRLSLTTTLTRSQTRAAWALIVFAAIQVADGVLTAAGASQYGSSIEANPLLLFLFGAVGVSATLVATKLFAILCATTLHLCAKYRALTILTVVYVVAAIVPWTFILTS
ncbi:MAG TPA: hypothetical protein VLV86_11505 [Vicinamibacterales bacterium]|nr:hypothetical protein [Vicinamibacterales bacterium]